MHFLHSNINSLLSKIDELQCIGNKTKLATIGITESKLDHTVSDLEVNIPWYDILGCDINRNGSGVACYMRKVLFFNARALSCKEIENVNFEILLTKSKRNWECYFWNNLTKSKPITVDVFYRPPNQANFMELIVKDFSQFNLKDNKIYLFVILTLIY